MYQDYEVDKVIAIADKVIKVYGYCNTKGLNRLARMLKEKSDTYDVVAPPPARSKSSGSKKQAASHKLESTDDFPTLGA